MIGVHKNTLILSNYGLKKADSVRINDRIWTNFGFCKVLGVKSFYDKTFKINTKSGKTILLNNIPNNIVDIIGGGWLPKNVKFVHNRLNLHKNTNLNFHLPHTLNESLAYFLGHLYGDGCIKKRLVEIAASDDYPEIKDKIVKCIYDCFSYKAKMYNCKSACTKIGVYSVLLVKFLIYNNLAKKSSNEMSFPSIFFSSKKNVLGSFVSGLLDSDGHICSKYKKISIASVSRDFIDVLNSVLWSWGIGSKVRCQKRKHPRKNIYYLSVNGKRSQKNFFDLCKDSVKLKRSNLNYLNKKRDNLLSIYCVSDFDGFNKKDKNNKVSYSRIEDLGENTFIKNEKPCLMSNQVKSVTNHEKLGKLYNFLIEKDGYFFANGIGVESIRRK